MSFQLFYDYWLRNNNDFNLLGVFPSSLTSRTLYRFIPFLSLFDRTLNSIHWDGGLAYGLLAWWSSRWRKGNYLILSSCIFTLKFKCRFLAGSRNDGGDTHTIRVNIKLNVVINTCGKWWEGWTAFVCHWGKGRLTLHSLKTKPNWMCATKPRVHIIPSIITSHHMPHIRIIIFIICIHVSHPPAH